MFPGREELGSNSFLRNSWDVTYNSCTHASKGENENLSALKNFYLQMCKNVFCLRGGIYVISLIHLSIAVSRLPISEFSGFHCIRNEMGQRQK